MATLAIVTAAALTIMMTFTVNLALSRHGNRVIDVTVKSLMPRPVVVK